MSSRIVGNHHITLSTGGAQEDWDFHTQALGLRPVKKTMLYDGAEPVYHLYYANADIDAGSILTSFPMRQQGKMGRRGSNQVKEIGLSIDDGSIDYWANRLDGLGFATEHTEALGTRRLRFAHPCGIPYTLVGTSGDTRRGYGEGGVPSEHGIKGAYAPVISVIDPDEMVMYL
jgi:glyoxalase family protein